MVAVVADDIVLASGEAGNDATIHRETRGIDKGLVLADKFCYFFLQLHM